MATIDPDTLEIQEVTEISLRSVFQHESHVFTPWLSRPENLARLSRALQLELEIEDTEVSTGTFRVDMIARNIADDSIVIIENQFSRSDHDHLGKAMTYLAANAGNNAKTVIWIAEAFADEHRAVLAWLNDNTPEDVGFYAVVPRMITIADSPPGLQFEVAVRPNILIKQVRESGRQRDESVAIKRRAYWPIFEETLRADPELSSVVMRKGGGLGYAELYPDKRYEHIAFRPYVLSYIKVPKNGVHTACVFFRPWGDRVPELRDRLERFRDRVESEIEKTGQSSRLVAEFETEEKMREIAQCHVRAVKIWLEMLRDEFAPEAAAVEV